MSLDLARIQVEVLEPGAVIAGNTNVAMYLNPPRPFHLMARKGCLPTRECI